MYPVRNWRRYNPLAFGEILEALGFKIVDAPGADPGKAKPRNWSDGVNDEMTRQLAAVLDLPQTDDFNNGQERVVSDWIMHARAVKDLSCEHVALLRRIIRDERVRMPTPIDQIVIRRPDLAKELMPDILDMMEKPRGLATPIISPAGSPRRNATPKSSPWRFAISRAQAPF